MHCDELHVQTVNRDFFLEDFESLRLFSRKLRIASKVVVVRDSLDFHDVAFFNAHGSIHLSEHERQIFSVARLDYDFVAFFEVRRFFFGSNVNDFA